MQSNIALIYTSCALLQPRCHRRGFVEVESHNGEALLVSLPETFLICRASSCMSLYLRLGATAYGAAWWRDGLRPGRKNSRVEIRLGKIPIIGAWNKL